MGSLKLYRNINARALSNYDSFDFAIGAGYKKYYAVASANNSTTTYILSANPTDGDLNTRIAQVNNATMTQDFDLTFNNPVVVASADAIVNLSLTTPALNVFVTVTLYHVSATSVLTSLGSTISSTITGGGASWDYRRMIRIPLTKHSVGIGEKLRLEIATNSAGAGVTTIYFDPGSRQTLTEDATGATIRTDLIVYIPFRIDL